MTDNGNGNPFSRMPWWVQAVALVGVPALIALGLVWSDRAQLASVVDDNHRMIIESRGADAAHDASVKLSFGRMETRQDETARLLRAICVNTAKTDSQRDACLSR